MAATMYLQNLLQYCARNCLIVEGKACHAQIIRAGLGVDTLTSNMLINMYCKCGLLHPARQVFDKMPERSLVSWNTMIGAHTQNGRADDALSLFVRMQREESPLSEFTVSSVLCACAAKSAIFECRQLHAFAVKKGIESNVYVGTALIDVYSKCNFMGEASWVFESLEEKSDVTWSSMVAGYVRNELYEEALRLYHRGQAVGLEQNQFTLSSVFSACTGLGALTEGNQVNATLFKSGFGASVFVASSLVDMYAKCGAIKEAYTVFSDQYSKNVVSWNAMISGFSRHGRCLEAMILFEKMQQTGLYPNEVTYLSVLSACGHMGLVKEGQTQAEASLKSDADHKKKAFLPYKRRIDMLLKEKEALSKEKEALSKEKETLSKEKEALFREKESLLTEREALLKERESWAKEKELLNKEKDEASKEKQAISKQLEDLRQEKKSTGDTPADPAAREKDARIQILENTVGRLREDTKKEKGRRMNYEKVITTKAGIVKQENFSPQNGLILVSRRVRISCS